MKVRKRQREYLPGFFFALAASVGWAVLASVAPGDRYHWAALLVAALWVSVDGSRGAGLTQRRMVNAALGGWAMAGLAVLGLVAKGDLQGQPVLLGASPVGLAVEHVVVAGLGAALGMALALRISSTPPRDPQSSASALM